MSLNGKKPSQIPKKMLTVTLKCIAKQVVTELHYMKGHLSDLNELKVAINLIKKMVLNQELAETSRAIDNR